MSSMEYGITVPHGSFLYSNRRGIRSPVLQKNLLSRPSAHRDGASRMLTFSHSEFVKIGTEITQPNHLALNNRQSDSSLSSGESWNGMPVNIAFSHSVNFDTGACFQGWKGAPQRIVSVQSMEIGWGFRSLKQKQFAGSWQNLKKRSASKLTELEKAIC